MEICFGEIHILIGISETFLWYDMVFMFLENFE